MPDSTNPLTQLVRVADMTSRREFTKETLVEELLTIQHRGWITLTSHRQDKDGGLGNTLEDLLDIPENNIPIADYGEFELKTHRSSSSSLVSLFRYEPMPRSRKDALVPRLIRNYGWPIKGYGAGERSLRIDMDAAKHAERGFIVKIDANNKRIEMHFDATKVPRTEYAHWLKEVEVKAGLGDLNPIPYWTFDDIEKKISEKLKNMVYVAVDTSREGVNQRMRIATALMLWGAQLPTFLDAIRTGLVQIELSARTHHNHGTAFRTWPRNFPKLYVEQEPLL